MREDKISMLPEKMPKWSERRATVMEWGWLQRRALSPKEENGYTVTQVGWDVQCVV